MARFPINCSAKLQNWPAILHSRAYQLAFTLRNRWPGENRVACDDAKRISKVHGHRLPFSSSLANGAADVFKMSRRSKRARIQGRTRFSQTVGHANRGQQQKMRMSLRFLNSSTRPISRKSFSHSFGALRRIHAPANRCRLKVGM